MSAFESPKLTNLTINGSTAKVYSKGVDQSNSTAYSSPDMAGWTWSITDSSGDYTLSANGTSFGQQAETSHIEMSSGTSVQMNTVPGGVFSHPSLWQVDAYMPDGSVIHTKGGGQYFLMSGGLPADTVFAELMLGPNTNGALDGTPQTETLAYIVNAGQTQTELFYVDTSVSQDGSSFGLLLNQADNTPITRAAFESQAVDLAMVKVAEVDYQMPVDTHNYTYPAPTVFTSLSASPGDSPSYSEPLGPDGYWTAPTPVAFDDQTITLIDGGTDNDVLDLTGITGVYELDAGFGSWDLDSNYDPDVGIIFIGDQYYEFKSVESYKVTGLSTAGDTIRFNALDDINETIEIGTGFGLNINLGVGELSDSDVVVFTGGSVEINLSNADGSGYVSYTYSDGSGSGSIRGADIIIGSTESVTGDIISGSDQRDVIVGLAGDDQLAGGDGDDFIIGGAGADSIDGGAGDDIIVDLDSDTLTGGEGRDVFVVNGTSVGGSATITDLDVSEDGLSFRGLDTDKYADRIAFTFSAATLAQTLAQVAGYDVATLSDPLEAGVYYQLARALDLNIVATDTEGAPAYELSVTYTDGSGTTELLGKVGFDVSNRPADKPAFNAADHVYKATLLEAEQVDLQLTEALLDQIASYATEGIDMPGSDAITLFVGVERADKNAIFGDGEPVLVAYRPDGIELATKFRPSSADEIMLGSRDSDVYAHSSQVFVDEATGLASGPQDFGRDTVVERGGANDVISLEVTLNDLLVGDLQLGRTERGREGDDRSLNIQYKSDAGTGDLNTVDMIVYKQFVDYDSSFRVEGLELVDPSGGYQTLSLGEAVSDSELSVEGSTNAILVGRKGQADTFTVRDSGTGDAADLYMVGFEYGVDSIDLSAYSSSELLSSDPADYDPTGFQVVATRADTTTVTYDIHFVPSIDDELVTSPSP